MNDLHCSHGPVSSMPGSSHPFPEGSVCDSHPDRPAVARIQGETDSFGCEYTLMCAECKEALRISQDADYHALSFCDWCKQEKPRCKPHRDMDEGMSGPLYNVCSDCRTRESEAAARELEENREMYGFSSDFDDYFDEDDEPPEQDLGREMLKYEQIRYRVRYYGRDRYVMSRDAQSYLEIRGRRVAERWLRQHRNMVRGHRVFLQPVSFY